MVTKIANRRKLDVKCVTVINATTKPEESTEKKGTSSKSTKLLWAGSRYLVKALVKLCSKDETLALKAVEVCGTDLVGAIFKAMSVFLKNAELQVAACVALEYISYYDVSASMISERKGDDCEKAHSV